MPEMSGNHPETIEYYKDLLAERDDELDCLKESMSNNMSNNNVEMYELFTRQEKC